MNAMRRTAIAVFCLIITSLPPVLAATPSRSQALRSTPAHFADLTVPFIQNRGQTDARVAYYATTFAGAVYVTRAGELVYTFASHRPPAGMDAWVLVERFVGGEPAPEGGVAAGTRISSFIGNDPQRWHSNLPTYQTVDLGEVWAGIDVELVAGSRNFEKRFTVRPGHTPDAIRLAIAGTDRLEITDEGSLVMTTGLGPVTFTPTIAYQIIAGERQTVSVAYIIGDDDYGFRLGDYDATRPVVIDPFLQSTYLGGSGAEVDPRIAISPATGEVIVAGGTNSMNFPGTLGGAQLDGSQDIFVARLNKGLSAIRYLAYVGGNGSDSDPEILIEPGRGDILIGGTTDSTDIPQPFPGAQPSIGGGSDGFVLRLDSLLQELIAGTYLGGSGDDSIGSMAFGAGGQLFVAGETNSADFPATTSATASTGLDGVYPNLGGGTDMFIARFQSGFLDATDLRQATYLGGSGDEDGVIAIDSQGLVVAAGITGSTDFPGTAFGAEPFSIGGFDAFIARLPGPLSGAAGQATYLGGGLDEDHVDLIIDPANDDIIIIGDTASSNFTNGATTGGVQPNAGAGWDLFLARLDASLDVNSIQQATFFGGNGDDRRGTLALNPTNNGLIITGESSSTDLNGSAGAPQTANAGGTDEFVARLNPNLASGGLAQLTYLGGSGNEEEPDLAIEPNTGDVFISGATASMNFPGLTPGSSAFQQSGAQTGYGGGARDGFVTRLPGSLADTTPIPPPMGGNPLTIAPNAPMVGNCFPFGFGTPIGGGTLPWLPFGGFIYQNIPPFELSVGDTLAFDLGSPNDVDVELDIDLAATVQNGGTVESGPFTKIVSNTQTPVNPRGDAVSGNYELQFSAEAPFSFAGGGLIMRFSNPSVAYQADVTCTQVLVNGDTNDSSDTFVERFLRDADGASPWDVEFLDTIGAFQLSVATLPPPPAGPNLELTKTADNLVLQPGVAGMDTTTFTVTVSNIGDVAAQAVVTDTLPAGLDDITGMPPSAVAGTVSIDTATNEVTLDVNLGPGQSDTLTIPAIATVGGPGCITNTATAAIAAGDPGVDSDLSNNSDSVSLAGPACADLEVEIFLDDALTIGIFVEIIIEFVYVVTNHGPSAADNVQLVTSLSFMSADSPSASFDPPPAGVSCDAPPSGANAGNGADVTCNLGTLAPGESVTITRNLDMGELSFADFVVTYLASIGAITGDPTSANDTDSGGVTVVGASTSGGSGGLCFIATAAYGSFLEPEVMLLRRFRDDYLLTNEPGRAFVDWYYRNSPPIAQVIAEHDGLRRMTRLALTPLVYGIKYPTVAGFAMLTLVVVPIGWRRRKGARHLFFT